MRDKSRIPKILSEIQEIWEENPDLRLGQLILNVARDPTLYYLEDEELIEVLKKVYRK